MQPIVGTDSAGTIANILAPKFTIRQAYDRVHCEKAGLDKIVKIKDKLIEELENNYENEKRASSSLIDVIQIRDSTIIDLMCMLDSYRRDNSDVPVKVQDRTRGPVAAKEKLHTDNPITARGDDRGHDNVNKKLEDVDGIHVLQIESQSIEKDITTISKRLDETTKELSVIKKKLGVRPDATEIEVDSQILVLEQKGEKIVANLTQQLKKERENSHRLSGHLEEAKLELKYTQTKLENKERFVSRMKRLRESNDTVYVADTQVEKYKAEKGRSVGDDRVAQTISKAPIEFRGNACTRCQGHLGINKFCEECYTKILYILNTKK